MRKRIVFVVLFSVFILVTVPMVPAAEFNLTYNVNKSHFYDVLQKLMTNKKTMGNNYVVRGFEQKTLLSLGELQDVIMKINYQLGGGLGSDGSIQNQGLIELIWMLLVGLLKMVLTLILTVIGFISSAVKMVFSAIITIASKILTFVLKVFVKIVNIVLFKTVEVIGNLIKKVFNIVIDLILSILNFLKDVLIDLLKPKSQLKV